MRNTKRLKFATQLYAKMGTSKIALLCPDKTAVFSHSPYTFQMKMFLSFDLLNHVILCERSTSASNNV